MKRTLGYALLVASALLALRGVAMFISSLVALGEPALAREVVDQRILALLGGLLLLALGYLLARGARRRLGALAAAADTKAAAGLPRSWLVGFATLCLVAVGWAWVQRSQAQAESGAVTASMHKVSAAFQQAVSTGQPLPPVTQPSPGEAGKIEVLMTTTYNRLLAPQRQYRAAMAEIELPKLLDPDRLQADPSLAGARAKIIKAREIRTDFQVQLDAALAAIRRDVQAADVKEGYKRSLQDAFDKIAEQRKSGAGGAAWAREEQVLGQIEAIVNLLAARQGGWQVRNRKIEFRRQADLDAFNAQLKTLVALGR